jgi:hypothetical protein
MHRDVFREERKTGNRHAWFVTENASRVFHTADVRGAASHGTKPGCFLDRCSGRRPSGNCWRRLRSSADGETQFRLYRRRRQDVERKQPPSRWIPLVCRDRAGRREAGVIKTSIRSLLSKSAEEGFHFAQHVGPTRPSCGGDLCLLTRWPFSPFPNASVSSTPAWPPVSPAKPSSATFQTAAQPSPGSPETASA